MDRPEYVFELLHSDPVFPGCIGLRHADMQNVKAREALIVILEATLQAEVNLNELDEALRGVPAEWPFLKVAPSPKGISLLSGAPRLLVARMEREPGRNSGENPVITDLTVRQARVH